MIHKLYKLKKKKNNNFNLINIIKYHIKNFINFNSL